MSKISLGIKEGVTVGDLINFLNRMINNEAATFDDEISQVYQLVLEDCKLAIRVLED